MINLTDLPQPLSNPNPEPVHPQNSAENFYRIFKRPGVKLFILLVAVALLVGAILRALTPATVKITQTKFLTTNENGTSSSFRNLRYTGVNFTAPKELEVANVQPSGTTNQDLENRLIEKFDLIAAQEPQNLWNGLDFYLSFDKRRSRYLLHNQLAQPSNLVNQPTVNKAEAVAAAQEFLQDIFPDTPLAPLEGDIQYYTNAIENYQQVSEATAQQLAIPFAYLIEGYPLFYEKQSEFPFVVRVDNTNEVIQATFAPQFLTITPVQKVPTISPSEALSNINEKSLGAVVKAQNLAADEIDLERIISGNLNRISIEYRLDSDLNLAFPFYRFDGSITIENGAVLEGSIITPAVATSTP